MIRTTDAVVSFGADDKGRPQVPRHDMEGEGLAPFDRGCREGQQRAEFFSARGSALAKKRFVLSRY